MLKLSKKFTFEQTMQVCDLADFWDVPEPLFSDVPETFLSAKINT